MMSNFMFLDFRNSSNLDCLEGGGWVCFAFVSFSMIEEVRVYESGLCYMLILRCHYSQAGLL